jgi:hypothetical protein
MNESTDMWYVRLPDGKVLRAGSTNAVRHHLETGRIPLDSRVRRAHHEEWVALQRTESFAEFIKHRLGRGIAIPDSPRPSYPFLDLGAKTEGSTSRRDNHLRLQTVGVRGLIEELMTALDSALLRGKLLIAGLVGLSGAISLLLLQYLGMPASIPWPLVAWLGAGSALILVEAIGAALVSNMVFIELTRLRPARWSEAGTALSRNAVRIIAAHLIVVSSLVAVVLALHELLDWLLVQQAAEVLVAVTLVVGILFEALLGPILLLALLLAPIVVIEECSAGQALWQWLDFVRLHRTRVFVYEALAGAVGIVASLPLLLPVAVTVWLTQMGTSYGAVSHATLVVMAGVALTPFVAYVMVANVFIYLNLRYEQR